MARVGPGTLPAFSGMAKGLCMVSLLMEEEEIRAGWGVGWGDAGHQSEAGLLVSPIPTSWAYRVGRHPGVKK